MALNYQQITNYDSSKDIMPYIWIWLVNGEGEECKIKALIDSGCTDTTIGEEYVKNLGLRAEEIANPFTVYTANGPLKITQEIKTFVWFGTHKVDKEFIRFKVGLGSIILIGRDIQHGNGWKEEQSNGLIRTKHNSEIPLIGSEIYEINYDQYVKNREGGLLLEGKELEEKLELFKRLRREREEREGGEEERRRLALENSKKN